MCAFSIHSPYINITPVIPEVLDRGLLPDIPTHISPVLFASYVVEGEPIAIYLLPNNNTRLIGWSENCHFLSPVLLKGVLIENNLNCKIWPSYDNIFRWRIGDEIFKISKDHKKTTLKLVGNTFLFSCCGSPIDEQRRVFLVLGLFYLQIFFLTKLNVVFEDVNLLVTNLKNLG